MNFFGAEAAEAAEPGFWQKAWEKVFPSAEAKRILGVEEVVASLERKQILDEIGYTDILDEIGTIDSSWMDGQIDTDNMIQLLGDGMR